MLPQAWCPRCANSWPRLGCCGRPTRRREPGASRCPTPWIASTPARARPGLGSGCSRRITIRWSRVAGWCAAIICTTRPFSEPSSAPCRAPASRSRPRRIPAPVVGQPPVRRHVHGPRRAWPGHRGEPQGRDGGGAVSLASAGSEREHRLHLAAGMGGAGTAPGRQPGLSAECPLWGVEFDATDVAKGSTRVGCNCRQRSVNPTRARYGLPARS